MKRWSQSKNNTQMPPIPPTVSALQVIREHWAELPVLHSSFPLASYFTHDTVYISLPLETRPDSPGEPGCNPEIPAFPGEEC